MADYTIIRFNKYTDDELVNKLLEFSKSKGLTYISSRTFSDETGIGEATITNHFGSWKSFCLRAGLFPRYDRSVGKVQLFENLELVWEKIGRQPRAKEMKQPLSPISISRYQKIFQKTWYNICLDFLSWKTGLSSNEIEKESKCLKHFESNNLNHSTQRQISLSLRYEVLKRDCFKCVKCGRTPASDQKIILHIDHIIPWSSGGESNIDNLQTLCSECNLGKSNKSDY
jgi:hypothetical protein